MGTLLSLTILESKNFIFALATLYAAFRLIPRAPPRHKQISPEDEHVLIIGASSGVGKELAKMYAKRGSRVCLVSRNEEQLKEAEKECLKEAMVGKVFSVVADFSDVEDMVRVRDTIHQSESCLSNPIVFPNLRTMSSCVIRVETIGYARSHRWCILPQTCT